MGIGLERRTHREYTKFAILSGLVFTGILLIALPTPADQNFQQYSAQVTLNELDASIGFAPAGYYTDAHIVTNNAVTVRIVLVESSTTLFSQTFQAGTFDIMKVQIMQGGNIFLTITPSNRVFTQMNVFARIFHEIATYQYAWMGVGVLGLAGLFGLAIFRPETGLGRLVYKILPIIGRY